MRLNDGTLLLLFLLFMLYPVLLSFVWPVNWLEFVWVWMNAINESLFWLVIFLGMMLILRKGLF